MIWLLNLTVPAIKFRIISPSRTSQTDIANVFDRKNEIWVRLPAAVFCHYFIHGEKDALSPSLLPFRRSPDDGTRSRWDRDKDGSRFGPIRSVRRIHLFAAGSCRRDAVACRSHQKVICQLGGTGRGRSPAFSPCAVRFKFPSRNVLALYIARGGKKPTNYVGFLVESIFVRRRCALFMKSGIFSAAIFKNRWVLRSRHGSSWWHDNGC